MPDRVVTERMVLRGFSGADVDSLAALHGDGAVMRYIDNGRPVPRAVVERETLPGILREYRRLRCGLGWLAAEDRLTGSFLGWFSLRPATSVGLDGGTELGYRLCRAVWGRGYATEGARAVVDVAFGTLGVDRIVATTMTVNVASRRVLEKAGLTLVRVFFADWPEPVDGAEHGDVVYELTRGAWETAANRRLPTRRFVG